MDTALILPTEKSPNYVPFWCVNLPPEEWPAECPDYLVNSSEKDKEILATPDAEYRRLSWNEAKELIDRNRLDLLRRVPSDLHRYRKYVFMLNRRYGSVMNYVLWEKLKWADVQPSSAKPFTNPDDFKVLLNDWPYGIDQDIVHIVVWTKFNFEEQAEDGDLTPAARKQIDDYVEQTFRSRVDPHNVRWFKNWAGLKSVKAVEHFHVMLYKPDMNFVQEIAGSTEPQFDKGAVNAQ